MIRSLLKSVAFLGSLALFAALSYAWWRGRSSDPLWVGRDWVSEWPDRTGRFNSGEDVVVAWHGRLVYHRRDLSTGDARLFAGKGAFCRFYRRPANSRSADATGSELVHGARLHDPIWEVPVGRRQFLGCTLETREGSDQGLLPGLNFRFMPEESVYWVPIFARSHDFNVPVALPTFASVLPAAVIALAHFRRRRLTRYRGFTVVTAGGALRQTPLQTNDPATYPVRH